jgi:pyruvate formate lyase activating enzyme
MSFYKWLGYSFSNAPGPAAVIYTKGCNIRCDYCFNLELLDEEEQLDDLTENQIDDCIQNLQRENQKTGKLYTTVDWLTVTGGEPLFGDLDAIKQFFELGKALGLKTCLYTNGSYSDSVDHLIARDLIDCLHIDYKFVESDMQGISQAYKLFNKHQIQNLIINTTIIKSVHTPPYMVLMKNKLLDVLRDIHFPPVCLSSQYKGEEFRWTLSPFFNDNDKIPTWGNLKDRDNHYTDDELTELIQICSGSKGLFY